jgi:hypothetical protein
MTLIASDLDRTLIYSRRFFADPALLAAQCVETYNGEPISYMTAAASAALQRLSADSVVVPATTRTIDQYQRVVLPGAPYRYAVTSNGGNILIDGAPDPRWRAKVAEQIADGGLSIDEIVTELRTQISDSWVQTLRVAEELFCYLVVDEAAMPEEFLLRWGRWCRPRGWKVSQQGRKIYTVPQTLCKSHAVAEVRRRLVDTAALPRDARLIAAGDGALDAELLDYADSAIRPAHGELHALNWQSPHTTVTRRSGAAAAEEILIWFAEQSISDIAGNHHRTPESDSGPDHHRKDHR